MFSGIRSILNGLSSDPVGTIVTLLYVAVCILFSLIIHECAHAYVALKCGDPTAKWLGRLTLDPRKHLDPLGTICMVFMRIGWAKPVPIIPRNFRHYKRDYILVSIAGIAVNLLICILSLLVSAILARFLWTSETIESLSAIGARDSLLNVYYNFTKEPFGLKEGYITLYSASAVYSGTFNDIYMNSIILAYIQRLFLMLAQMNLGLAVFNLLPVPPLDGYRVLDMFVFRGRLNPDKKTMRYISLIFMVLCMSGVLTGLLTAVNSAVMGILTKVASLII